VCVCVVEGCDCVRVWVGVVEEWCVCICVVCVCVSGKECVYLCV
jgi:hypothetical protein